MRRLLALTVTALLGASACGTAGGSTGSAADPACATAELGRPGAGDGIYLGVNPDWGAQSLAEYAAALGSRPAVTVSFTGFPLSPTDARHLDAAVEQVRADGGLLLLTLEPHEGLAAVTDDVAADLAERLAGYNGRGVPVVVRFSAPPTCRAAEPDPTSGASGSGSRSGSGRRLCADGHGPGARPRPSARRRPRARAPGAPRSCGAA
ncbi:hypothetical protein ABC795_12340 [Blastococcus sp. HT6-30]|uniref:hypothetical protein n=1 Tax=Blastococcus sp. HT6-30 TaxID=3144843 RepID=UPI00321B82B4